MARTSKRSRLYRPRPSPPRTPQPAVQKDELIAPDSPVSSSPESSTPCVRQSAAHKAMKMLHTYDRRRLVDRDHNAEEFHLVFQHLTSTEDITAVMKYLTVSCRQFVRHEIYDRNDTDPPTDKAPDSKERVPRNNNLHAHMKWFDKIHGSRKPSLPCSWDVDMVVLYGVFGPSVISRDFLGRLRKLACMVPRFSTAFSILIKARGGFRPRRGVSRSKAWTSALLDHVLDNLTPRQAADVDSIGYEMPEPVVGPGTRASDFVYNLRRKPEPSEDHASIESVMSIERFRRAAPITETLSPVNLDITWSECGDTTKSMDQIGESSDEEAKIRPDLNKGVTNRVSECFGHAFASSLKGRDTGTSNAAHNPVRIHTAGAMALDQGMAGCDPIQSPTEDPASSLTCHHECSPSSSSSTQPCLDSIPEILLAEPTTANDAQSEEPECSWKPTRRCTKADSITDIHHPSHVRVETFSRGSIIDVTAMAAILRILNPRPTQIVVCTEMGSITNEFGTSIILIALPQYKGVAVAFIEPRESQVAVLDAFTPSDETEAAHNFISRVCASKFPHSSAPWTVIRIGVPPMRARNTASNNFIRTAVQAIHHMHDRPLQGHLDPLFWQRLLASLIQPRDTIPDTVFVEKGPEYTQTRHERLTQLSSVRRFAADCVFALHHREEKTAGKDPNQSIQKRSLESAVAALQLNTFTEPANDSEEVTTKRILSALQNLLLRTVVEEACCT